MAYRLFGCRKLKVVSRSSHGPTSELVDDSSRGHVEDRVRQEAPKKVEVVVVQFEVPLLSREGPTRRLLAGAAAPWSPALDPVFVPAVTTDCFDFVEKAAQAAAP